MILVDVELRSTWAISEISFVPTGNKPKLKKQEKLNKIPSFHYFQTAEEIQLSTVQKISNNEADTFACKSKHSMKFGENMNGRWQYRFAAHARFSYWDYNILYRKRLVTFRKVCTKQNFNDNWIKENWIVRAEIIAQRVNRYQQIRLQGIYSITGLAQKLCCLAAYWPSCMCWVLTQICSQFSKAV